MEELCFWLQNVYRVSVVRQLNIYIAELSVPDPSHIEVETATVRLKRYKSQGNDQTPAELIQTRGEILRSEIHKLIHSIWNMEELTDQW
jgi:hypothetical protein